MCVRARACFCSVHMNYKRNTLLSIVVIGRCPGGEASKSQIRPLAGQSDTDPISSLWAGLSSERPVLPKFRVTPHNQLAVPPTDGGQISCSCVSDKCPCHQELKTFHLSFSPVTGGRCVCERSATVSPFGTLYPRSCSEAQIRLG